MTSSFSRRATLEAFLGSSGHEEIADWRGDPSIPKQHFHKPVVPPTIGGRVPGGSSPNIDFAAREWRDACIKEKAVIPAGYTYLGQLIGHDMGHSVPLEQVPYSARGLQGIAIGQPFKRYNAIENPLTLWTIYGAGPEVLGHLYDPKTRLFRIHPHGVITKLFHKDIPGARPLADKRNRDTHLLHRITAIIMRYHNRIAKFAFEQLKTDHDPEFRKNARKLAFCLARNHVLLSWHAIIREDFLPRFLDPDVAVMPIDQLLAYKPVDDTTMQHGIWRAFHCLPRGAYNFDGSGGSRALQALLMPDEEKETRLLAKWPINWSFLFEDIDGGTKTGISTSFSPALRPRDGMSINDMDVTTAQTLNPQHLESKGIRDVLALMPPEWAKRLTSKSLAEAFTKKVAAPLNANLTEQQVGAAQIFLILLIEAQLYGKNGRFGPLGSILLRRKIEEVIGKVRVLDPGPGLNGLQVPRSFIEFTEIVSTRE